MLLKVYVIRHSEMAKRELPWVVVVMIPSQVRSLDGVL